MTKLAFAHYFTPYLISLDNKMPASLGGGVGDYYDKNFLTPSGEGGIHAAYGGMLRDRPIERAPYPSTVDYQALDMQTEVRQGMAAGLDGFTMDLLGGPSATSTSTHLTRQTQLIQAAVDVGGFKVMLMPDMQSWTTGGSTDPTKVITDATAAARIKKLAAYSSVFRLDDGRLVLAPFYAERWTPARWKTCLAAIESAIGGSVAFVPCFLNYSANIAAFKAGIPQMYGASIWGDGNPGASANDAASAANAHSRGLIWMQPVIPQDERPNQHIYDEAGNTENLRVTWQAARDGNAEWVQGRTWNDYSEGAQIAPSARHGWTFTNLFRYYCDWWKAGTAPTITTDQVFLTHRQHPFAAKPTGGQTSLMTLRSGSTAARDTIEVATLLTASSTVDLLVNGSVVSSQTSAAGFASFTAPLQAGTISARVRRAGQADLTVPSPRPAVAVPVVQDLQYVAATAQRSPVNTVSVLFGVNDAAVPAGMLDTLEGAYSSGAGTGISNRVPIAARLNAWSAITTGTTAFSTGSRELALFNAGHEVVVSFRAPSTTDGTAYSTITAGTYDSNIQALFDRIYALDFGGAVSGTQPGQTYGGTKAQKVRVVFQTQADVTTGKGTATDFRAAYRHFFSVGKARRPLNAAERVVAELNLTVTAATNGQAALYYPGNTSTDFVDEVSVNAFASSGTTTSLQALLAPFLSWMGTNAPSRKLFVLQCGIHGISGQPTLQASWMAAAVAYLASEPRVSGACWWSADDATPPSDYSVAKTYNAAAWQGFHDAVAAALSAGTTTDVTAPSAPGKPSVVAQTTTTAQIAWTAPPEPDVAQFKVKLDGTVVQTITDPTVVNYTITGLSASSVHSVTVVALDGAGNTSVDSLPRMFTQPSSTAPLPPAIDQTATSVRRAGATVTGTAVATDPASGTLVYTWAWGDQVIDNGSPATHVYTAPGDYTVTLTVLSSGSGSGLSSQQTFPVTINNSAINRTEGQLQFFVPPTGEPIDEFGPEERANWQLTDDTLTAVLAALAAAGINVQTGS
jgi:hypothetical protein